MNTPRWILLASVLFGFFALYSAAQAIPNALLYPRGIGQDSLRFGLIFVAAAVGVAMLLPHRWVPALRTLAEHITPAPVHCLCGLAMVVCLSVARLADTATLWIIVPLTIGFTLAFFIPGFAFRNVNVLPRDDFSMEELNKIVGEELRSGAKHRLVLFLLAVALIIIGLVGIVLGPKIIPAPDWATFSGWFAVIFGGVVTAIIIHPWIRLMPRRARRGLLPHILVFFALLFPLSIAGNRAMLLELLPAGAAYLWGEETAQTGSIIRIRRNYSRKFCSRPVHIRIETKEHELCNLSSEFLRNLSLGDTLVVAGKATRLGQRVRNLNIEK